LTFGQTKLKNAPVTHSAPIALSRFPAGAFPARHLKGGRPGTPAEDDDSDG